MELNSGLTSIWWGRMTWVEKPYSALFYCVNSAGRYTYQFILYLTSIAMNGSFSSVAAPLA